MKTVQEIYANAAFKCLSMKVNSFNTALQRSPCHILRRLFELWIRNDQFSNYRRANKHLMITFPSRQHSCKSWKLHLKFLVRVKFRATCPAISQVDAGSRRKPILDLVCGKLVSFVRPKELYRFDPCHVIRSRLMVNCILVEGVGVYPGHPGLAMNWQSIAGNASLHESLPFIIQIGYCQLHEALLTFQDHGLLRSF